MQIADFFGIGADYAPFPDAAKPGEASHVCIRAEGDAFPRVEKQITRQHTSAGADSPKRIDAVAAWCTPAPDACEIQTSMVYSSGESGRTGRP